MQPTQQGQVTMNVQPIPQGQVTFKVQPIPQEQVTIKVQPTPQGHVTINVQPTPQGQVTISVQPIPQGQVTIKVQPKPQGQVTIKEQPIPQGQVTIKVQPIPQGKVSIKYFYQSYVLFRFGIFRWKSTTRSGASAPACGVLTFYLTFNNFSCICCQCSSKLCSKTPADWSLIRIIRCEYIWCKTELNRYSAIRDHEFILWRVSSKISLQKRAVRSCSFFHNHIIISSFDKTPFNAILRYEICL